MIVKFVPAARNVTSSINAGASSDWLSLAMLIRPVINDIKLRYLCRNKLPRIIFVLMHGDDYVINVSSVRPGVWR